MISSRSPRNSSAPRHSFCLSLFVAFALLSLAFAGCFKRGTAVEQGNREQILHRGIGHDLADLDPHFATQASDYNVLSSLLEGLVSEDPVDLHPVPGVAERWDISADGLVYTFYLRANARWSNGDPVTAQDFLASYKRMLTPSLGADYANLLYIVQGAEAYNKGEQKDFAQVGFAAPDARTLRITLDHPASYFLSLLNHTAWFPVPLATIAKSGPVDQRGNAWARPGTFIGNGPFVLKAWRAGQEIVVEKSPTYWDAANVKLHAIHFHAIDSLDTEERAFRSGQLHLTEALPPGKIEAYQRNSPALLRIDPLLGTYFYRLNVTRPPLTDVRIRRALALAIDRDAIVKKILRGGQLPAASFTPPGIGGYTPPALLSADLETARRLLIDAGYPNGRGLPRLELTFNTSETHRVIAEAIQEMWRRDLGIDVQLSNQELKSTLETRRAGNYQILRSVWTGDYNDPSSFLNIWTSASGNNYTRWSDTGYDALLFEAERTADPAARNALFAKAETRLLQAAPLIPIYHYTHVFLIQPSVKGWYPTLLDHHPYKSVWLEN